MKFENEKLTFIYPIVSAILIGCGGGSGTPTFAPTGASAASDQTLNKNWENNSNEHTTEAGEGKTTKFKITSSMGETGHEISAGGSFFGLKVDALRNFEIDSAQIRWSISPDGMGGLSTKEGISTYYMPPDSELVQRPVEVKIFAQLKGEIAEYSLTLTPKSK